MKRGRLSFAVRALPLDRSKLGLPNCFAREGNQHSRFSDWQISGGGWKAFGVGTSTRWEIDQSGDDARPDAFRTARRMSDITLLYYYSDR